MKMKFSEMHPGQKFAAVGQICIKLDDDPVCRGKNLYADEKWRIHCMSYPDVEYEIVREDSKSLHIDSITINA